MLNISKYFEKAEKLISGLNLKSLLHLDIKAVALFEKNIFLICD